MTGDLEPLGLKDDATVADIRDWAKEESTVDFLPDSELTLAKVEYTFVDEDGVMRRWSIASEDFDEDDFEDP